MSEDQHELRGINWGECFFFTNIFRTFRLAIHPAKLILALGIIVSTCLIGVLLDTLTRESTGVIRHEIHAYHHHRSTFDLWHADHAQARAVSFANLMLSKLDSSRERDELLKEFQTDKAGQIKTASDLLEKKFKGKLTVEGQTKSAGDKIKDLSAEDRDELVNQRLAEAGHEYRALKERISDFKVRGVFVEWLAYQRYYFNAMLKAAVTANFFSGFDRVGHSPGSAQSQMVDPLPDLGVLACACMMAHGEAWMLSQHPLYALVFCVLCLPVWAFLGGALCRIAALHVTRDEKIAMTKAVKFSAEKFVNYVFAPLVPVVVILVIGLFLIIGGSLLNGPGLNILSGLLFFLALLGGGAIAFMLIGGAGGLAFMWPTIAIEGSDSFDALSRSFNYILQKPWKALFYGSVALVYGAACTLFVRLFAFLLLTSVHLFVGIGVFQDRPDVGPGFDKLDVMWQSPSFDALRPIVISDAVTGTEKITAFLIQFWVYLIPTLVYAFVLSFFFCAATIIYTLLRREVDATDLDDVYLDEYADEDFQPDTAPAESGKPNEAPQNPGGLITPTIGETDTD